MRTAPAGYQEGDRVLEITPVPEPFRAESHRAETERCGKGQENEQGQNQDVQRRDEPVDGHHDNKNQE